MNELKTMNTIDIEDLIKFGNKFKLVLVLIILVKLVKEIILNNFEK